MSVKFIPYIYGKADKKFVDRVEMARPSNNGVLATWWRAGNAFCTQYDNGYYHCYIPEKQYFGKILQHYYINRKGELKISKGYYNVPTKEDLISWCQERGIQLSMQDFE